MTRHNPKNTPSGNTQPITKAANNQTTWRHVGHNSWDNVKQKRLQTPGFPLNTSRKCISAVHPIEAILAVRLPARDGRPTPSLQRQEGKVSVARALGQGAGTAREQGRVSRKALRKQNWPFAGQMKTLVCHIAEKLRNNPSQARTHSMDNTQPYQVKTLPLTKEEIKRDGHNSVNRWNLNSRKGLNKPT